MRSVTAVQRPVLVGLALGCLAIAPAQASEMDGVYLGKLGNARVLVELRGLDDPTQTDPPARYSYYPKVMDLSLVPVPGAKQTTFLETPASNLDATQLQGEEAAKLTGKWIITVRGSKVTGTWSDPKGDKTLPIALERLDPVSSKGLPEGTDVISATYLKEWGKSITFGTPGAPAEFGRVALAMVAAKPLAVEYPRVTRFPDAEKLPKINAMLEKNHRASIENYRDCRNGNRFMYDPSNTPTEDEGIDYSFSVLYATPRLLSIEEAGSVFCGGAHPNNYVTAQTYDLTTLTKIGGDYDLDFTAKGFGKILKLDTEKQRAAFARYWWDAFQKAAKAAGEDGKVCTETDADILKPEDVSVSFAFTKDGMNVRRTDYPHVLSVCLSTEFNPVLITWEDLKPWLKPGQTLLVDELK